MDLSAALMASSLAIAATGPWVILIWRLARPGNRSWRSVLTECGCLFLVEAAGIYATWSYFSAGLIGAGDIYHYALQLADGVTQARHGAFPLVVGQSDYAFNGNVHTLRTAPYYVHFGVVLDGLTGGKLPFAALENLTLMLSTLGGAVTAYYAGRRLAPGRPLAAALLAGIYITGPGLLAPVYHYDLLATVLTAPWLPLFWLGIILSLQWVDDLEGLALSVWAGAMLWYVHPPTAAWVSPALPAAQLLRLVLVGRAPGNLWRPVLGAVAAVLLTSYEFYSVHSLHLAYSLSAGGTMPAGIVENLQAAWPGSFLRSLSHATTPYADLQLGYVPWLILAAAVACSFQIGLPGVFLAVASCFYLALVLPVPGLTLALWRLAPHALLDVTNAWPMQRFYPILTAVAAAAGALAVGRLGSTHRTAYRVICGLLLAGFGWNLMETAVLQRQAPKQTTDPVTSRKSLDPRSLALTRSSYMLFGALPPHFSHGHMDPAFELRILDEHQEMVADNTSAVLRSAAGIPSLLVSPQKEFLTDGIHDYLLDFSLPPGAVGSIVIQSRDLKLSYFLPQSGSPEAFGDGPASSRTLPIRTAGRPVQFVEIGAIPGGITARVIPFLASSLPLQLESLIPLTVSLEMHGPGYLETPRVFIPGYRATVNGLAVPIVRSEAGLVAVPLKAGRARVVVDYPGDAVLRTLYFGCMALLAAAFVGVGKVTLARLGRNQSAVPLDRRAIRRYRLLKLVQP